MQRATREILRTLYPAYRPVLSRFGLLEHIARMHKTDKLWHGYLGHYRRHFGPYRNARVKLLEIGIGGHETKHGGGSLKTWKDYFPNGEIFGLDLYDKSFLQQPRITILRGDQNDPDFLDDLGRRHGPFDIVIDDGSHVSEHIITSFKSLFKHVKADGLYVIEDLYLSYEEKDHGGSTVEFNDPRTANGMLKTLVEELHWKYIPGYASRGYGEHITGVCFYPKICFIEKGGNAGFDPYLQRDRLDAARPDLAGAPA